MGKDNLKETLVIKEADESNLNVEKFDYGEIAENIIKEKINAYIDDSNIIKEDSNVPIGTISQPAATTNETNLNSQETHSVAGPFAEVFEPKDIVNRVKTSDYIVDDLLKRKQEQEKLEKSKQHFYISKAELDSIINDNPRMQMFKKNDNNELEEVKATSLLQVLLSNLKSPNSDNLIELAIPTNPDQPAKTTPTLPAPNINASENSDDEYITPHTYSDDEEDTYYISEEDAEAKLQKTRMEMTLKSVQDVIDKLTEEEKYLPPDELFREFLQENFKDFLLAKKISGNKQVKYADKIVPKENIKDDKQVIEVSDLNKSQLVKTGERTSILINRDEEFNIESIEVLCKCGEKTIIKFQEQTEDEKRADFRVENKSYTDVVLDTIDVTPIITDASIEDEYANFDAELSEVALNEIQDMGAEYD